MNKLPLHMVIPDCQVRSDVDYSHLKWVANYAVDKRPTTIINLGDFADIPSLSKYDIGKRKAEGKRLKSDIEATHEAMGYLSNPLLKIRKDRRPNMVLTGGNHENRIETEIENNPRLEGMFDEKVLRYEEFGWKVHRFLKITKIDGIEYCHYFVSGVMGKPVTSATALLRRRHSSAVMGHVQKIDIAVHPHTEQIGIFAGICYQHDEDYLGPQNNSTKRGIWMFHEIHDGTFDIMFVSLDFLKRKYS